MVDSRQKGARAENQAKELLIKHTRLNWQRVPMSGALDEKHGLKGDLYIPNEKTIFCVEVKHYKDDHLTSKILTSKNPQLLEWWKQTIRESGQVDKRPLLLFKYDRSKWFCAEYYNGSDLHFIMINHEDLDDDLYIYRLEDWLKEGKTFIK